MKREDDHSVTGENRQSILSGASRRVENELQSMVASKRIRPFLIRFTIPSLIFVVCLMASIFVSNSVFERVPHLEDEVAFVFQAKTYASGHLYVSTPAQLQFVDMPFLVDFNGKWFGKYPPGHPLILAIGELFGQSWLVDPVAASLALVGVYLIGRKVYGKRTAVCACLLGLASPFFLLQAGSLMSHPTTLLFVTVFIYCFQYLMSEDHYEKRYAILAGACLGMAFLSRQLTALAVAVPFVVYGVARLVRFPRQSTSRYLWLVMAFFPFLVAFFAYNWLMTDSPFTSTYELYWPIDRIGFGPGIGPDDGHNLEMALLNTKANISELRAMLFGWPWHSDLIFMVVAAIGVVVEMGWRAMRSSSPSSQSLSGAQRMAMVWDLLFLGMAFSLVAAYMLYWAAGAAYGPRYYFEAMPAFLLLSARGITRVAGMGSWGGDFGHRLWLALARRGRSGVDGSAGRWRRGASRLVPLLTGIFLAGLIAYSLTNSMLQQFASFRGWYGINGDDARLARQLTLGRSIVFVSPGRSWTDYITLLALNSPTMDSNVLFALDLGENENLSFSQQYPDRQVLYWQDLKDRAQGDSSGWGQTQMNED